MSYPINATSQWFDSHWIQTADLPYGEASTLDSATTSDSNFDKKEKEMHTYDLHVDTTVHRKRQGEVGEGVEAHTCVTALETSNTRLELSMEQVDHY